MLTAQSSKELNWNAWIHFRMIKSQQKSKNVTSILAGQMHFICQECSGFIRADLGYWKHQCHTSLGAYIHVYFQFPIKFNIFVHCFWLVSLKSVFFWSTNYKHLGRY